MFYSRRAVAIRNFLLVEGIYCEAFNVFKLSEIGVNIQDLSTQEIIELTDDYTL